MRQIEHKIVNCAGDKIENALKEMEKDGWELATLFDDKHEKPQASEITYHLVFKRKT